MTSCKIPNKEKQEVSNWILILLEIGLQSDLSVLGVSVRIRFERDWVNDAFVEDESVLFGAGSDFDLFGGWMTLEEVRIDDVSVASFVEWIG